jgi:GAF domain-containing protein
LSNDDLNDLQFALRSGVISALRYLNARTPHRFTGIFKYENETLRNLFLVDREDEHTSPWPPFPATHSYCGIMQDTARPFVTGNAHVDDRLTRHPARDQVISYCGVPLRARSGVLYASLCHFDYRPILFSAIDLDFVCEAAPYIMDALTDSV